MLEPVAARWNTVFLSIYIDASPQPRAKWNPDSFNYTNLQNDNSFLLEDKFEETARKITYRARKYISIYSIIILNTIITCIAVYV